MEWWANKIRHDNFEATLEGEVSEDVIPIFGRKSYVEDFKGHDWFMKAYCICF